MSDGGESLRTVVVAGLVNLAIAAAKAITGLLSGSAAMLSEAVHSLADTATEALLFVAVRRGHFGPSFAVLGIAFVLESVSLAQGLRQARGEARGSEVGLRRYLRYTTNTAVKAVVFEDLAALTGLVIAALGLGLTMLTGSPVWDGSASVAIGLLLFLVGANLVRANASLLIGQAVPAVMQRHIREELTALPEIERVEQLFTSIISMTDVVVAARVKFTDAASAQAITAAADEAERRLSQRFPSIRYVFLDPTSI